MVNDGQAGSGAAGDAKSALPHRPQTEVRQLRFRDDYSLGTLFYRRPDDGHLVWAFLSEARGLVTVPRAYELVLTTENTDESACSWSTSLHDAHTYEVSLPHPLSFPSSWRTT